MRVVEKSQEGQGSVGGPYVGFVLIDQGVLHPAQLASRRWITLRLLVRMRALGGSRPVVEAGKAAPTPLRVCVPPSAIRQSTARRAEPMPVRDQSRPRSRTLTNPYSSDSYSTVEVDWLRYLLLYRRFIRSAVSRSSKAMQERRQDASTFSRAPAAMPRDRHRRRIPCFRSLPIHDVRLHSDGPKTILQNAWNTYPFPALGIDEGD